MLLAPSATESSPLLGGLLFGALIATISAALLLPSTKPYLTQICRAEHRGLFWTRLLGISLVCAILVGVILGSVAGSDSEPLNALVHPLTRDAQINSEVLACASMLRLGLMAGSLVLFAMIFGVLLTPRE